MGQLIVGRDGLKYSNEQADAPLASMSQQFFLALMGSSILLMSTAIALRVFFM
jgi:hypothetical protein